MWRDLNYALSASRRNLAATILTVASMGVGIAVSATTYAVINGVLLRPLPYGDQDRLAVLWQSDKESPRFTVATANFLDWKRESRTFADMAAIQQFRARSMALAAAGEPEQVDGVYVTWNLFKVLGVEPVLGHGFGPRDGEPGHTSAVLISNGLWLRRFGGSPSIIGEHVTISGVPVEIAGVLPRGFQVPLVAADIVAPLTWNAAQRNERLTASCVVVGRLKPSVSLTEARAEMKSLALRLAQAYPSTNNGSTVVIDPLYETIVGDVRDTLLTLFGAAMILLVIGSASVSNLFLARFVQRRGEFAVRVSLGARPWHLARQILVETFVLASAAGVLGLLASNWAVHALLNLIPETTYFSLPRRAEIGVDFRVGLFTVLVMIVSGLIVAVPTIRTAVRVDLSGILAGGDTRTASTGRTGRRMRQGLVVTQWALALLLMLCMMLTLKSYVSIDAVQPGFRATNITTGQVTLPPSYSTTQAYEAFFESAVERLQHVPGVVDASLIDFAPLSGVASVWSFHIVGRPEAPESEWPAALHSVVWPNYCQEVDIPLLRGRYFDERDNETGAPVVLISQAFAKQAFGDTDPIDQQLVVADGGPNPRRIVGVVGDVQSQTLIRRPPPHMYVPFQQAPQRAMTLVLKSSYDSTAAAASMREVIRSLDRGIPVAKVRTLDSLVRNAKTRFIVAAAVLTGLGLGGLAITIAAIYGMTSLALTWRLHEIGIRLALGASRWNVMRLFVRESLVLTTAGVVLGLALTWTTAGFLKVTLYGVDPHDTTLFTVVPIAALLLGAICAGLAALKILRLDARAALLNS